MEFRNGSFSCRANPRFIAEGMYFSSGQIVRLRSELFYSGPEPFSAGFGDDRLEWITDKSGGAVYRWQHRLVRDWY